MPDSEPTSEDLLRQVQELDLQILDLSGEAPWEQLGQTADQAQAVEDYLGSVIEDIGSAKDDIGEKAEDFASAGEKFEELLEIPEVKEALEGIQGGLDSSTNLLEEVKGGVGKFKEFVETLQLGEGLTSDDAQEQLETAAEAFELIVGKLEPFIDLIPGLGAFIQLWGLGIKRAAEVAGVIIERTDTWNQDYSTTEGNEGDFLYQTDTALKAIRLEKLKLERAERFDQMIETGIAENAALDDINLPDKVTDRDIAVETAIRKSSGAQVPLMTPAYREWGDATKNLEEASAAQGRAQANFDAQSLLADEAAVAAETDTRFADDRLTTKAASAASARDRAQTALDGANANLDAAVDRHTEASAAHWDEVNGYRDAVKANLIRIIPSTNSGNGFSDADYQWLASTYPQFAVSRVEVEAGAVGGAVSAAATGAGAAVAGGSPMTGAVGGAVAGSAVSAGMSSGTKKFVMIGGGIFALMMLFAVIVILPGDSQTPGELSTAPAVTEPDVTEVTPTDSPPTEADKEVEEPADESPEQSDAGSFEQPASAALAGVGESHGLTRPFVALRTDVRGDTGACGSDPGSGPGSDVIGIVAGPDGDLFKVVVSMAQSPTTSATQFSFAVVLEVTLSSGVKRYFIYEMHNGRVTVGEQDAAGNALPGSGGGSGITDTAATFHFMVDSSDPVALLSVQGFNLPSDGDAIGCDNAVVAAHPFPSQGPMTPGTCTAGESTACLGDDRFGVEVTDSDGGLMMLQATESDAALFGEGGASGLVRVLNGCETNGHFWVFSDGFMDEDGAVWQTIVITDTHGGEVKVFTRSINPLNTTVEDTAVFGACP